MARSSLRVLLAAALAVATALLIAACGGSDEEEGGEQAQNQEQQSQLDQLLEGTASQNDGANGRRGGTITMLSAGDVDYIDTGKTYYSYALGLLSAAHRTLYSYLPNNPEQPVPDLAEAEPEISEDGRTVTVRIRDGVRYSPPVNREVTSDDVKYAIERGFTANVSNGYVQAYMGDLVGAPDEPGDYQEIRGIETPDDRTIVFRLERGTGAVLAGALGMPISAPVPQEYAEEFDQENPSTYGEHQVATGPYMIENNEDGELVGYQPARRIHFVRNPNYEDIGDFRPAYVDEWDVRAGNEDSTVAARRILAGQSLISGDGGVPPAVLRQALTRQKSQISLKPSGGFRFISMDTSEAPFDDINVRKAVIAGFDRNALRLARGGEAIGPIANHYIPPGIPGFEESGGEVPPNQPDYMRNPEGDRQLAARYFREAGFQSGRYEGNERILMVADNADPDRSIAQIAERQLQEMGFDTTLRLVSRDTMYTRYCNDPQSGVHVCPSVGWLKDFSDPQTMLDPTFNGENILDTGNSNWPELDVEALNQRMNDAKLLTDPQERAQEWAAINREIVAQAPGVPYVWDYEQVVGSSNVNVVQNAFSTLADLNFTSLK